MGAAIRLPKIGLTMQKGKVTRWLKREGEQVEKGEPVLEFMTEKVTMTVEAPESGLLSRIDVPAGVTVPVGAVLGWVGEPGEAPPASAEVAGAVPG
ncbi:MAG: 2-oxo acid dehydrogenase subunit E2, partial [Clostridia bacterium]|nr:2-oxo acid dehydrogenase subunit E2 [Clostridia bacterium]